MIRTLQKIFSPNSFCGCIGKPSRVYNNGRCAACGRIGDIPYDWRDEFNAAVETTAIQSRRIYDLQKQMERPTVEMVETALHVYAEKRRSGLSDKGAMRAAMDAAFAAFDGNT